MLSIFNCRGSSFMRRTMESLQPSSNFGYILYLVSWPYFMDQTTSRAAIIKTIRLGILSLRLKKLPYETRNGSKLPYPSLICCQFNIRIKVSKPPPPFQKLICHFFTLVKHDLFDPSTHIEQWLTTDQTLWLNSTVPYAIPAKNHKNPPTLWVTLRLTPFWWPLDLEQEVSLLHYEKRQTLPRDEITTDPGSCPKLTFAHFDLLIVKYWNTSQLHV